MPFDHEGLRRSLVCAARSYKTDDFSMVLDPSHIPIVHRISAQGSFRFEVSLADPCSAASEAG